MGQITSFKHAFLHFRPYLFGRIYILLSFVIGIAIVAYGLYSNFVVYKIAVEQASEKKSDVESKKQKEINELLSWQKDVQQQYSRTVSLLTGRVPQSKVEVLQFNEYCRWESKTVDVDLIGQGFPLKQVHKEYQCAFNSSLRNENEVHQSLEALTEMASMIAEIKDNIQSSWFKTTGLKDIIPDINVTVKTMGTVEESPDTSYVPDQISSIYSDINGAKSSCTEFQNILYSVLRDMYKNSNGKMAQDSIESFNKAWQWLFYLRYYVVAMENKKPMHNVTKGKKLSKYEYKTYTQDGFQKNFGVVTDKLMSDWQIDRDIEDLEAIYHTYLENLQSYKNQEKDVSRQLTGTLLVVIKNLGICVILALFITAFSDYLRACFDASETIQNANS